MLPRRGLLAQRAQHRRIRRHQARSLTYIYIYISFIIFYIYNATPTLASRPACSTPPSLSSPGERLDQKYSIKLIYIFKLCIYNATPTRASRPACSTPPYSSSPGEKPDLYIYIYKFYNILYI